MSGPFNCGPAEMSAGGGWSIDLPRIAPSSYHPLLEHYMFALLFHRSASVFIRGPSSADGAGAQPLTTTGVKRTTAALQSIILHPPKSNLAVGLIAVSA